MDHGNFWGVEALVVVGFPRLWSSWTTPMCTCARSPWGLIAVSTHRTEACQTSPLQDPTPACLQSQVPAHLCVFPSGASGPLPKEQAGPKGKWPPLHPALDGLCSGQAYETPTPPPSRRSRHMQKTGSQTSTTQWDPGGKHEDKGVRTMCQDQPRGIRKASSRR